jgi:hypothetical protein
MTFERWGSLSVADHIDTRNLVANVLLYDRLVFPTCTEQPDRNEPDYWRKAGWEPELQAERVKRLGDRAIKRPWDEMARQEYKNRVLELKAGKKLVDYFQITRDLGAESEYVKKLRPKGVHDVNLVAAYNSEAALQRQFKLAEADDAELSAQAYILSRRLAFPDHKDSDQLLTEVAELSRDTKFCAKRSELFTCQESLLGKHSPQAVVDHLVALTEDYNTEVKKAWKDVYWKYTSVVCSFGLGLLTGGPIGAGLAGALSLAKFVKFDMTPAMPQGPLRVVAMFHDVENKTGITITN